VKKKNREAAAQEEFARQALSLWPALKGSLRRVRKPCIRPGCPACARGDKHPAWLLSFTRQGKRHCMYVPIGLAPQLRRALKNGRRLEQLLYAMGPKMIREHRQARLAANGGKTNAAPTNAGLSKKKRPPKS